MFINLISHFLSIYLALLLWGLQSPQILFGYNYIPLIHEPLKMCCCAACLTNTQHYQLRMEHCKYNTAVL